MTPEATLLWALSRDLGLDGFRVGAPTLAADYTAACKASLPMACEISAGAVPRNAKGVLELAAVKSRASEWCDQDDRVACLLDGMLRVRDPFSGYRTDTSPEDERTARTAFATACDAGLARGCTELGMAYLEETWSYRSEVMAKVVFQKACEAGEPEGCHQYGRMFGPTEAAERRTWLQKAVSMGNVQAAAELARLADDPAATAAACEQGSSSACTAAGFPERACATGNPDACLTELLQRAVDSGTDRVQLTETMRSLCPTLDRACREAEFLRDGSPVVASEPGLYASPGLVERYIVDYKDQLRLCHVRALKVNPDANGVLDVWLRIAESGQVVGAHIPNPFDQGLADCADRVLRSAKMRSPLLGTMLAHVLLPFDATTTIEVQENENSPEGGSLALLQEEMQRRGDALDRCVITHDDPRYVQEGEFVATAQRDGGLAKIEWPSADFEPETRACIDQVFAAPFRAAPLIPSRISVKLHFLDEAQIPTWKIVLEPLPPVEPDHFRLLALVPASATIEGVAVASLPDAEARIQQVHAKAAALVSGFTRGGLVVDTDVRIIPDALEGPSLDVEDDELTRLRFEAFDVPDTVWSRLPVGRYDGIVLWVPVPSGRTADIGTTTNATLRGASFSALPMPGEKGRSPRVETLLHGLWMQYATRVHGQLGTLLHSADQRLEAEGQVFDNEFWTLDPYRPPTTSGLRLGNQTGDVLPFYGYLFSKVLHPAMRADLARLDRRDAVDPDDLALLSIPLREGGARNVEVLTDGRRALDPPEGKPVFQDGSWISADRAEDPGWWGVEWPSAVEVRRIRVRLGDVAEGPPSVKSVAFEGREGDNWISLSTVTLGRADVTLTLPATRSLSAVRVRVLERAEGLTPTCTELEVYATAK